MVQTQDLLTKSLEQALEKMAFVTIMPPEDELAAPEETILAEISFKGPKAGTIQILAGLDLCRLLARNIAALTEVDDENCLDALKELSNVTCGLILPELAGSAQDVFDITIPTIKDSPDRPSWNAFVRRPNSLVLNIEGHAAAAGLIMEK
jgi:CheY-specific phosphatase CheX